MFFDKTREKVKEAAEMSIAQPVRSIGMIAVIALIVGIIGVILAVRR